MGGFIAYKSIDLLNVCHFMIRYMLDDLDETNLGAHAEILP